MWGRRGRVPAASARLGRLRQRVRSLLGPILGGLGVVSTSVFFGGGSDPLLLGPGACALIRPKVLRGAVVAARKAISKMQRLIVALCLSAAAALVPNSAAARSNNAKAPLKVGLPASVARISHPVLVQQALNNAAAAVAALRLAASKGMDPFVRRERSAPRPGTHPLQKRILRASSCCSAAAAGHAVDRW